MWPTWATVNNTCPRQTLNAFANPYEWYKKARDEDMLGVYIWALLFFVANL
jgi:hypothetical protein